MFTVRVTKFQTARNCHHTETNTVRIILTLCTPLSEYSHVYATASSNHTSQNSSPTRKVLQQNYAIFLLVDSPAH